MLKLMTAGALALVSACAGPTYAQGYKGPAPMAEAALPVEAAPPARLSAKAVMCDIRESRTAKGLRLEAVAEAGRPVKGSYDFVITAQASGGSSAVTQGGALNLAAGQGAVLAGTEIPRGRYRAELTLSDADGELCHLDRRS